MLKYLLLNRTIVEIKGKDSSNLLQGLITQDIELVKIKHALPSLLLTNKGRYLLDFFIIYQNNSFLIDITTSDVDLLINTINYYKLRSDVKIHILNKLKVYVVFKTTPFFNVSQSVLSNNNTSSIIIEDSRLSSGLGLRVITESHNFIKEPNIFSVIKGYFKNQNITLNQGTIEQYNTLRYLLVIPENTELTKEKSIPLEYNFDELNTISFNKGCYLGQEFTNASKRTLVIKKRLVTFKVLSTKTSTHLHNFSSPNNIISNCNNESVGTIVGKLNNFIMAVVKLDYINANNKLYYKNNLISLNIPLWLQPKIITT